MSTTPEREARAALMRAADVGDAVMGRLVSHCGASQAVEAIRARTLPPGFPADDAPLGRPADLGRRLSIWHARLTASDPASDLMAGERSGARLIIPGDAEWPTQLDQLGAARPLGLWLHGTADLRFSCLRSVAVVGARAATAYGVHIAAQFGVGLSESGWTVVSGGAFGIDGAAHRGVLASDSPTVAVLACGVDIAYPSEHHALFAAVRDQGVLVSECPPGVHPTRARFLIRNRLIAALSRGTVVVEAALRSGALNTATHALSLKRHLAAVPGPVTSAQSAGCHRLLREQKAICVTSPEELIDLVGVIGDDLAPLDRAPALPRDALSEPVRRVLDAVPARGGAGPASIAVAAGVDLNTALSALGGLAAAGYVERVPKGWRARKTASPIYPKAREMLALSTPPADHPPPTYTRPPAQLGSPAESGPPAESGSPAETRPSAESESSAELGSPAESGPPAESGSPAETRPSAESESSAELGSPAESGSPAEPGPFAAAASPVPAGEGASVVQAVVPPQTASG